MPEYILVARGTIASTFHVLFTLFNLFIIFSSMDILFIDNFNNVRHCYLS